MDMIKTKNKKTGKNKLTKDDVIHVADISNLKLTPHEVDIFYSQISKIVEFVGSLSEVDTKDVEPTSQTTGLKNVYRKDEVLGDRMLSQKKALSGTENIHNGFFKVGAILEGRTDK